MFPYGAIQGDVQPYVAKVPMIFLIPAFNTSAATYSTVSEAIATESPRDSRIGCIKFNTAWTMYVSGWEFTILNVAAGGFPTGLNMRIWVWRNSPTTGLPAELVSGFDTGVITIANARIAAGSDAETASSGQARCVMSLPAVAALPPGEYTLAFAIEKAYTGSGEAVPQMPGIAIGYPAFGGSSTAALRRNYGYTLSGATSSLAAYSPPSTVALGSFSDGLNWAEAAVGLVFLCAAGL